MYIYESHLGGLYTSDLKISRSNLYCDECGDSDSFVCEVKLSEDFQVFLRDCINTYETLDTQSFDLLVNFLKEIDQSSSRREEMLKKRLLRIFENGEITSPEVKIRSLYAIVDTSTGNLIFNAKGGAYRDKLCALNKISKLSKEGREYRLVEYELKE